MSRHSIPDGRCVVPGCKFFGHRLRGMCQKHYSHNWNYGHPTIKPLPRPKRIRKKLPPERCSVYSCDFLGRLKRGFCPKHYSYWYKHGCTERHNPEITPLALSPTDAAWIAGIVDGEGCINLCLGAPGKDKISMTYRQMLQVVNTDKRMIDHLFALTKVGVIAGRTHRENPRAKTVWVWNVVIYEDLKATLAAILPYLIVKKRQAELILALPPKHARDVGEIRRRIYDELKILNRRGISR